MIPRVAGEGLLHRTEELFSDIANTIQEVFWVRDARADRYLYVSPMFETVFGFPEGELLADGARLASVVHPDDRARYAAAREEQCLRRTDIDFRIVRPDGA